ncbi:IclR family transcriptional regulator [Sphingobium nicotianae]|uniref:IclR family transcriptional regulator n=1 Tax=Sphingobium nicotianae TaxID=2782607 RepID=A0A9X1IRZ4_9SPHN|nr:IclR family transcriptional regulator [Sphingobium nicotianae]MBT2187829.1 IclR family transcriptional regulator [Sphingobium nicotianae]
MASRVIGGAELETGTTGGVMAIRLVLEILEALATRDTVGVTELSKALDTTKARVFRHLRTLVDQGYAVQNEGSERYAAGPRLLALSRAASLTPHDSIVRIARPTLSRLRDTFGHTVNLSLAYGDSVSIVESIQGNALIGVVMSSNEAMPRHATAAGKLLLAEDFIRHGRLPTPPLNRYTENTIVDLDALRAELLRVHQQGWADAPEEIVLGINALSAPIRDHRNELVAMVSIMSSIQFIPHQPARKQIEAVKQAAADISRALRL